MESVTLPCVSPRFYKIQIKKTFSKNYDKNFKERSWDLYIVSHICWNKNKNKVTFKADINIVISFNILLHAKWILSQKIPHYKDVPV